MLATLSPDTSFSSIVKRCLCLLRYQFFLQVKRDILHGRLPVSFEEAVELFAYAVQCMWMENAVKNLWTI